MSAAHLRTLLWNATKFKRPYVIGMVHVPALPGTPNSTLSTAEIMKKVKEETNIYAYAKVDAIMVENMHDIPYVREGSISPEVTANMTCACIAVNEALGHSVKEFGRGIQILAAANRHAIAVAHACDFDFIRAECYTFAHIGDEGPMSACAGELLRYRRQIGADHIAVITDVKKKHSSHAITGDLSIGEIAAASEFFAADGVIVTGSATGSAASVEDLEEVQKSSKLPVFIGSGMTVHNVSSFTKADGFIVGSYFKEDGDWRNKLESAKVESFMRKVRSLVHD